VVSFVDAFFGGPSWRDAAAYLPAQVAGYTAGAVIANLMFALPAVTRMASRGLLLVASGISALTLCVLYMSRVWPGVML
jgi:hypothetical protein